ncbi:MAG: DnaJ domain-containing protein [Sedimenticola sp.]|nr:DnaJ domain-containing protein [Sedimenticola sp.]MCW8974652.1 DnaJ domain-containing protein [Sedimenticola sp.]MCW9022818.1 DnaJ domain-containing protein [Sedimenticola sp.]
MDNGAMYDNPLIVPILALLHDEPEGLSEHEIIKRLLESGDHFSATVESGELALFQKHFLVMNALYQIQDSMLEWGMRLQIDPLLIRFIPSAVSESPGGMDISTNEPLRHYYLDWKNLHETSESDVTALLGSFWDRYYAIDKQAEALSRLGLDGSDELNWSAIQSSYRQLITRHHPDKGGEQARFIEIREAYELLKKHYTPTE